MYLMFRRYEADRKTHDVSTAYTTDPVHIILLLIRQGHIDDTWQLLDVQPTRSHVGTDHKAHIALLERRKVAPSLVHRAHPCKHHA